MKVFSFKNIRIVLLLGILASVAIYTQEQRLNSTSWIESIDVIIYPINADANPKTTAYINSLTSKDFEAIDRFFIRSAKKYQLIINNPVNTSLGPTINSLPPRPPSDRNAILNIILWSIKLRYWAYKNSPDNLSNTQRIRLYVLYQQGNDGQALNHSLGLQKGLIGIINAYAKKPQNKQSSIIMAHEILHTVGASDKYDIQTNLPLYPIGYAKPEKEPLYPQRYAEIMAGRTPVSPQQALMPKDLRFCLIGKQTAQEINWITSP